MSALQKLHMCPSVHDTSRPFTALPPLRLTPFRPLYGKPARPAALLFCPAVSHPHAGLCGHCGGKKGRAWLPPSLDSRAPLPFRLCLFPRSSLCLFPHFPLRRNNGPTAAQRPRKSRVLSKKRGGDEGEGRAEVVSLARSPLSLVFSPLPRLSRGSGDQGAWPHWLPGPGHAGPRRVSRRDQPQHHPQREGEPAQRVCVILCVILCVICVSE